MKNLDIYLVSDKGNGYNAWVAVVDTGTTVFSRRGKSKYKKGTAYVIEGLCDVLDKIWYKETFDLRLYCNNARIIEAIDSRFITKLSINIKDKDDAVWRRLEKIYLKFNAFDTYKIDTKSEHYLNAKSQMNNMLGK